MDTFIPLEEVAKVRKLAGRIDKVCNKQQTAHVYAAISGIIGLSAARAGLDDAEFSELLQRMWKSARRHYDADRKRRSH